jgi:gamma-glutamyl-gamma-aminobutyrate hydrolase PuuD
MRFLAAIPLLLLQAVIWSPTHTAGELKIGITQRVLYHRGRAYDSLEQVWYKFLKGHRFVFIPNTLEQDFEALTDSVDALIITGGDDSAIRRSVEFRVASLMMQQCKPILGICHGAFMLTDVLGGQVESCDGHLDCEHSINYLGLDIKVNSYHNQAIVTLHSSAHCLARDPQGHCEAWIDGAMAGIVWHPERMQDPFLPSEIQQLIKI